MGFCKSLMVISLLCLSNIALSAEFEGDSKSLSGSPPSFAPLTKPYSILLIEEGENSLGIYNSETRKEIGRIKLNFYPHEIEVSDDMKRAYVSNFGIRDYDAKIGYPGNSVSIIDLEKFCEIGRFYTTLNGRNYWGPHGLKLHPDGKRIFVNVECVNGRYPTSNAPQESMILIFNLDENVAQGLLPPPLDSDSKVVSYQVMPGTHNFLFAPHGTDYQNTDYREIWYYSGSNGVSRINSETGALIRHYPTNAQNTKHKGTTFNGAVRGLSFNAEGTRLLVSAKNEISIIDVKVGSNTYGEIIQQIGNLGVGQLFYSKFVPGKNLVLAPAARESQVLVIDISPQISDEKRVVKRFITGVDPLQVMISPFLDEQKAFVTNADSSWVSEIDLEGMQLSSKRIPTKGGANGIAFSNYLPSPPAHPIKIGVCLPFTGQYAAEGRECFLGIQFWQETINNAGGIVVGKDRYQVEICHEDTASSIDEKTLEQLIRDFVRRNSSLQTNQGIVAMFGTYPSYANLPIARTLNQWDIPLITSTGRDPALFNAGLQNLFGISPVKHIADLTGTFQTIYRHTHPKPITAMILACKECDSQEEAKALAKYISRNGVKVLSPFNLGTLEEPPIISFTHCLAYQESRELKELSELMESLNKEAQQNCQYYPDLLFVSGHRKESAAIIDACNKLEFTYGTLALNVGITSHHFLVQVPSAVENILGSVCWSDGCFEFAKDRFVGSTDFQRLFYERYSEDPSELVAGFAASGIVVEEGLKKCKTHKGVVDFSGQILLGAIRPLDLMTFYGPITFDFNTGANTAKQIITVQLKTVNSKLKGVPVWPVSISGKEKPTLPLSRMVLKKIL
ncbi:MAG: ABC transporter substrate-binding protein [Alphaproteobacteria bacterium]|nr:ABC transporter substrate-binding protein [Alphaproteobacteria bacterium]